MLHDKNVTWLFWAEAMKIKTYVINLIPQQCLEHTSPFQNLWSIKPNVSHLCVFGCVSYVFYNIQEISMVPLTPLMQNLSHFSP